MNHVDNVTNNRAECKGGSKSERGEKDGERLIMDSEEKVREREIYTEKNRETEIGEKEIHCLYTLLRY